MPIGQPDSVEPHADRLIREAMEAGEFDELKGTGKPIPGAGTTDDDLWWVRSWIQRNLSPEDPEDQDSTRSE
ncbi:MAG TPA: DnaJ family domain-containing protein [Acidimicrobiia bacterium]|nr:DnaJ family domain-containing protein [Acidimicrobiia bacterium]